MKILLTSDLHGNRFWYEWLIAKVPKIDMIAIAGDLVEGFASGVLTDQKRAVEHWLGQIVGSGCAVAVSSGNHEMFSKISPRVAGEKKLTAGRIFDALRASPSLTACHPLFIEDGRTGIVESASGKLIVSPIPYKIFRDPEETSNCSPMWDEARRLKRQTGFPWLVLHHDPPGGGPVGGMAGDFELRRAIENFQPDFSCSPATCTASRFSRVGDSTSELPVHIASMPGRRRQQKAAFPITLSWIRTNGLRPGFSSILRRGFSSRRAYCLRDAAEQLFRRMVFNIVARNQDDHVKNIAFLMDQSGTWSLSPAFDVTYNYQPAGEWTSSHQMTLNGKRDGFQIEDFRACARTASLKRGRADAIVGEIRAVVKRWQDYADEAEVTPRQREKIQKTLRLESFG